jgi:hypothetical protein
MTFFIHFLEGMRGGGVKPMSSTASDVKKRRKVHYGQCGLNSFARTKIEQLFHQLLFPPPKKKLFFFLSMINEGIVLKT